ncbi:MAG TPA: hypothetical protein VFV79_00685 [Saprospiraceae bacterium]|nr:hypothetical protein [Saprospiraceae bacterium]
MKKIFCLLLIVQALIFNVVAQVGIGTTIPNSGSILELKSNNKGFLLPRTSTATRLTMTGAKGLMMYDTSIHQVFYHTGVAWKNLVPGPYHWTVSQADDVSIFNNNTGFVGIGTADYVPYKFSVFGTIYTQESAKTTIRLGGVGSTTEARILWELPSNTVDFNLTQYQNDFYISRTVGATGFVNDLVVSNNGWVGIGTENPQTRLTIDGGSDVGNGSGGYLQLGLTSGLNVGFDNNEIQGRSNGLVSRLVLNNGGGAVQVGSAITPAGYSFSVNGKVICEELKIQPSSSWPDYVFTQDYQLPSLAELRDFIHTNHHLPNIPSAKQVEENGVMVGDMQRRMMEKIEELTLYVLQLEEKCAQLQSAVNGLSEKK